MWCYLLCYTYMRNVVTYILITEATRCLLKYINSNLKRFFPIKLFLVCTMIYFQKEKAKFHWLFPISYWEKHVQMNQSAFVHFEFSNRLFFWTNNRIFSDNIFETIEFFVNAFSASLQSADWWINERRLTFEVFLILAIKFYQNKWLTVSQTPIRFIEHNA